MEIVSRFVFARVIYAYFLSFLNIRVVITTNILLCTVIVGTIICVFLRFMTINIDF